MISEPELEGEQSGERPVPAAGSGQRPGPGSGHPYGDTYADTYGDPRGHGDGDPDPYEPETLAGDGGHAPPPRGRPLLWALGGALVASALWACGLYAYHGRGPDLDGYRATHNLCAEADLTALSTALGPKRSPHAVGDKQPELDRSVCSVDMGPAPGAGPSPDAPLTHSTVHISYDLYLTSDPGAEFEASLSALEPDGVIYQQRAVPGLGDRAYLVTGAPGEATRLVILDGQADLALDVRSYIEYGHGPGAGNQFVPAPVDRSVIEPALVRDARLLMAALRK
ncbi:hypothetical protein [Streptomyces sp. 150FB]|uniref:hypothetical protein n=1 Tax=Streptomyces sp. 150FB TaxID=1576605 RepID=UPI000696B2C6|nr:hypothetical protein [Streptomyces sp. 150FB]